MRDFVKQTVALAAICCAFIVADVVLGIGLSKATDYLYNNQQPTQSCDVRGN